MGKEIPSELGKWWDVLQGPSLEVGSPLEVEPHLDRQNGDTEGKI